MARQRKGAMQMAFDILPIDKEKTRQAVEDRLETVRLYRQFGDIRREVSTTASYELRQGSSGGTVSKQTENVAVYNVDTEARHKYYDELLTRCMNKLRARERVIIEKCYLDDDPQHDFVIAMELEISDGTFKKDKSKALYNLAWAMKIYVLEEDEKTDVKTLTEEERKEYEEFKRLSEKFGRSNADN